MKRLIITLFCLATIYYTSININKISDFLSAKIINEPVINTQSMSNYTNSSDSSTIGNEFAKKEGFMFAKINNSFIPYSYQDLIDIVFTIINSGVDTFTFYCPNEYSSCIDDMEQISKDDLILTHINNFVHPFNSFTMLSTSILESGEVTININHLYTNEQIEAVNNEVDRIMKLLYKNINSTEDNIKAIHDYIINNTRYDESINTPEGTKYASAISYGALFDHLATCNGYTDTMAIFLSKMGITNYKIGTTKEDLKSSDTGHIWNAVYLNDKWLHLDLTWDDPVSDNKEDLLYHNYFLIDTQKLIETDNGDVKLEEHNFNKNIYLEYNEKSKIFM